jgi:hypothetical protein
LGLYARVAAVLLAAITATGVWSSLRRMPAGTILDQLTTTAYGRTLLAKVILVAAVAVLALWARYRLRQGLRSADRLLTRAGGGRRPGSGGRGLRTVDGIAGADPLALTDQAISTSINS